MVQQKEYEKKKKEEQKEWGMAVIQLFQLSQAGPIGDAARQLVDNVINNHNVQALLKYLDSQQDKLLVSQELASIQEHINHKEKELL